MSVIIRLPCDRRRNRHTFFIVDNARCFAGFLFELLKIKNNQLRKFIGLSDDSFSYDEIIDYVCTNYSCPRTFS